MNKKITTLLASAMLATAFSAGASINAKKGEATLLGASSNYLSVNTENNYGALSFDPTTLSDLKELNPAIKIIGVDPVGSVLGGQIEGETSATYQIEGIGYDFFRAHAAADG